MRMRFLMAVMLAVSLAPGRAQEAPVANPGYFRQLFPEPSGLNGYEDLVLASDLARAAESRLGLHDEGVTLSQMRAALAEPDRRRAIALLRQALTKPFTSPRATISYSTTFPELGGIRSLARLLSRHMRVQFADGNHSEAIADLKLGWDLGASLHGETLIGSLVGIACNAITMREFQSHLEELSARDCDRVTAQVARWLREPDPTIAAMESERRLIAANLAEWRSDPKLASALVEALEGDGSNMGDAERQQALSVLRGGREEMLRVLAEAGGMIGAYLDRCTAEARRPYWQRRPVEPPGGLSPAAALAGVVAPVMNQVGVKFASVRQTLQMLGVHVAILRYRWEHDAAPASLDLLKLGSLGIDPLNGKPFAYRALDRRRYEVTAAAPPAPPAPPQG